MEYPYVSRTSGINKHLMEYFNRPQNKFELRYSPNPSSKRGLGLPDKTGFMTRVLSDDDIIDSPVRNEFNAREIISSAYSDNDDIIPNIELCHECEDDVKVIMDRTGSSRYEAIKAYEESNRNVGDAILTLI